MTDAAAGERCQHEARETGETCGELLCDAGDHEVVCSNGPYVVARHHGVADLLASFLVEAGSSVRREAFVPELANEPNEPCVTPSQPSTPSASQGAHSRRSRGRRRQRRGDAVLGVIAWGGEFQSGLTIDVTAPGCACLQAAGRHGAGPRHPSSGPGQATDLPCLWGCPRDNVRSRDLGPPWRRRRSAAGARPCGVLCPCCRARNAACTTSPEMAGAPGRVHNAQHSPCH